MVPQGRSCPAAENSGDKAITECILNTQMSHYILPFFYTHFFPVSNNITKYWLITTFLLSSTGPTNSLTGKGLMPSTTWGFIIVLLKSPWCKLNKTQNRRNSHPHPPLHLLTHWRKSYTYSQLGKINTEWRGSPGLLHSKGCTEGG